jgi:uncharacterized damage-inducible protein DinB
MDVAAFRHFYAYHFAENRKIWEACAGLSDVQFDQPVDYAHGSVRAQLAHLIGCDEAWFSDLSGQRIADSQDPDEIHDRAALRAYGERVEALVRAYLAGLTGEMLTTQPLEGEDQDLYVWQVLLHVVNHGTDHRAQLLRSLYDLGVQTGPQDYIFYVYEHP